MFGSEWNGFARIAHHANFGEAPFGDITKIKEDEIPEHDLPFAGFPCQPFPIAGVSKKNGLGRSHGFLDGVQGILFSDMARIIKRKRPRAFMPENVKNLISRDKGRTFEMIYNALDEPGHSVRFRVLDGKHFVPQYRERIIIAGFDRDVYKGKDNFRFPALPDPNKSIAQILEPNPEGKYTLSDKLWGYLQHYAAKHKAKGNGFGFRNGGFEWDFQNAKRKVLQRGFRDTDSAKGEKPQTVNAP